MTKLKKDITITIQTVEEAVALHHCINVPCTIFEAYYKTRNVPWAPDLINRNNTSLFRKIREGLEANKINPYQEIPQPLKIASREVTASPDGSIKVECTEVSRAELEAAYKPSTEAMQQEPVWPKWWINYDRTMLLSADSETDLGTYHYPKDGHKVASSNKPPMAEHARRSNYTPLTAIEAARILEGKQ